jgi:hypothetical protein
VAVGRRRGPAGRRAGERARGRGRFGHRGRGRRRGRQRGRPRRGARVRRQIARPESDTAKGAVAGSALLVGFVALASRGAWARAAGPCFKQLPTRSPDDGAELTPLSRGALAGDEEAGVAGGRFVPRGSVRGGGGGSRPASRAGENRGGAGGGGAFGDANGSGGSPALPVSTLISTRI